MAEDRAADVCVGEGEEGPWTEKYRPTTLDGVAGNADVVEALQRLLAKESLPHLLFHGPPGTGKTSTILACARKMYGTHVRDMVLEINASDDNGIGTVRDTVSGFARTTPVFAASAVKVKLIVLDEAEYLSAEAQAALKRVMEQVAATARFCFVCNCARYISPAIQSRCARFRFQPLPTEAVRAKIRQVASLERLVMEPGAEDAVVAVGLGDMRRVLNTLQSCAFRSRTVTARDVYVVSGRPSPDQLDDVTLALCTLSVSDARARVLEILRSGGLSLADVVAELSARAADPAFALYLKTPGTNGAAAERRAAPVQAPAPASTHTPAPVHVPMPQPASVSVPVPALMPPPASVSVPVPVPVSKSEAMCYLASQLAKVELALAEASDDDVQVSALAAAFYLARHLLTTNSVQ
jgi:replication factor C subunit 3/5